MHTSVSILNSCRLMFIIYFLCHSLSNDGTNERWVLSSLDNFLLCFRFFLIKFVDVFVHICMINFHFTIKQFSSFSQYFPYVPLHAVDASAQKEITVCEKTFDNSELHILKKDFVSRMVYIVLLDEPGNLETFEIPVNDLLVKPSSFQFLIYINTLSIINNVSKKQIILVWHLEPH